jgi:4-amino-4-deoxy-L-arabinose transferase-like glycosyltransferase
MSNSPYTGFFASPRRNFLLLLLGGFLSFSLFSGTTPLFDWDEVNFAESAREMLETGDYLVVQIDYEPFWEKPPLFLWMQAASMKVFGVNAFAARFPNALIGVATLAVIFIFGSRIVSRRFAWITCGFYLATFLPHLYFKSGIIDPTFNLFIFLGIIFLIGFELTPREFQKNCRYPLYAGLFTGLGVLTKGPVALLVTALIYFIYKGVYDRFRISFSGLAKYLIVFAVVVLSWFGALVIFTPEGAETVKQFIQYQAELFTKPVAGHEQPFYYHMVVFLVGCFPLSAFAFRGMAFKPETDQGLLLKRFALIWFWVVMILFSIVKTKIIHYSSLVYFPAAIMAAFYFEQMLDGKAKMRVDQWIIYFVPGILLAGVAIILPIVGANPEWISGWFKDEFARQNLTANVGWSGWEWLIGFVLLSAVIAGAWSLMRNRMKIFLPAMVLGMALYLNLLSFFVGPKIAGYTQQAATDFFASKANEDVYLLVVGYKSYAHLYFGKTKPFPYPEIPVEKRAFWMQSDRIDKPVFMVTKVTNVNQQFYNWFPQFKKVGEEAGFVFFRRDIPTD